MEIYSSGEVVGITDRIYNVDGPSVTFDDVLVNGDLSGELEYNGAKLRVEHVGTMIGFEITMRGGRGPVWKNVRCGVIKNSEEEEHENQL